MHKSKRCFFTEQENLFIRESVKRIGEDWESISKKMPGRTPKQIHDRYVNYLREGLKNSPWSKQEDELVKNMYKVIGPKWSKMMINLPGRSGNDIKNRWHKHICKSNLDELDLNMDSIIKNEKIVNAKSLNDENIKKNLLSNDLCLSDPFINGFSKDVDQNKSQNLDQNLVEFQKNENSQIQSSIPTNMLCFSNKLNSSLNLEKNNEIPSSLLLSVNEQNKLEDKLEKNIKLINKINIEKKNDQAKYKIESKCNRLEKVDFDINEIFDEICSEKMDFLWI